MRSETAYMFMRSSEDDVYYQCTHAAGLPPVITGGKIIRYTWKDIKRLMKRPNHWCLPLDYGEKHRPPFPTLENVPGKLDTASVVGPAPSPDIKIEDSQDNNNNAG